MLQKETCTCKDCIHIRKHVPLDYEFFSLPLYPTRSMYGPVVTVGGDESWE